jgi:hypothetical protein
MLIFAKKLIMAKQDAPKKEVIVEEVVTTIADVKSVAESLTSLKEKATQVAISYKTEEISHALVGVSHSIEILQTELDKFYLEVEKVESLKAAQTENK